MEISVVKALLHPKKGVGLLAAAVALFVGFVLLATPSFAQEQVSFGKSTLGGATSNRPTSLQFGPDGRLYVAEQHGIIKAYTVERNGANDYSVLNTETIDLINTIPNHYDNGTLCTSSAELCDRRQVTGILVAGTEQNPVIYVSSSDARIGAGTSGTDKNLDTNSGMISRLNWDGSKWVKVDLVRGLPRSEENHSPNGMQLSGDGSTLYLAQGGNTNQGAPSTNFAKLPEVALSAAILSIDLTAIGNNTYDLPTLDDEDRSGVNDANDPFGGNNGKNQAKLVSGGPVQVYAPGFRNAYDLVIAESGKMYTIDNGGNQEWGDVPQNEGPEGNCTNALKDGGLTNQDNWHYISGKGYYGGHPNPTRANKSNTFNSSSPQSPVEVANPIECDYQKPANGTVTTYAGSTNGLAEYTASNFGGAMKGDLLAAGYNKNVVYRTKLNSAGDGIAEKSILFSEVGNSSSGYNYPLDLTSQSDTGDFPGTVWVADVASSTIYVFEPAAEGGTCDTSDPNGDADGDGFTNQDEIDNGTDPCSSADVPRDSDKDGISDLNDPDDDNDGISDKEDPFAVDSNNGKGVTLPVRHDWDNDSVGEGGLENTGFTGLMTNGQTDYRDLYNADDMTVGGAGGLLTIDKITDGDAFKAKNTQENAFQFGVDLGTNSNEVFTATTRIMAPFAAMTPENNQSMGLAFGTGDQDNYIKLVTHANGGGGGIEFAKEVNGEFTSRAKPSVPMPGPDYVDLFLTVDPVAKTVQPSYVVSTDGKEGPRTNLGVPATIPESWIDGSKALAVGIISTSSGPAPEFGATWDFIEVVPGDGSGETPVEQTAEALVQMTPNNSDINASTYGGGSFMLTNNSATEKIGAVTLDLSTAFLPDMIFDPDGTAGDTTGKGFTVSSEGGTGQSGHTLFQPHNGTDGGDGYEALKINFNDFDPGETFTFAIDVDPNSIKGTSAPGPNQSGSVSGLELSGSTITTAFDNGSNLTSNAFSDGSKGGSKSVVKDNSPAAPGIQVAGVSSPATVNKAEQTVKVTGPAGAKVRLLRAEAGLFVPQDGGYNVEPYDANSAVAVEETPATIGSDGSVDIPVTLTRQTSPEAGVNHLVAVIEDADNKAGLTSKVIVLDYDPDSQTDNQAPTVTQPADQSATEGESFTLQVEAADPDGDALGYEASGLPAGLSIDAQTGKISGTVASGAAANSPYQVTVKATDPEGLSDSKSFTFTVNAPGTDPTEPGEVIYRVNAGGPKQSGTPEWGVDTQLNPSPYVNAAETGNKVGGTSATIDMSDPSIPEGTPEAVFKRERWDPSEAPEMAWAFPVDPGTYHVRLYFAETFSNIDAPGKRVFDVLAEGEIKLDDYDVFAETGALNKGIVETFEVSSDGTLNVDFTHGAKQHPAIKGIEVLSSASTEPPANEAPVLEAIGNQSVEEGQQKTVSVAASDPDGDQLTLSAEGLPSFATFTDDGGGKGTLNLAPKTGDAGTYQAKVTASDGTDSDSESFTITVTAPAPADPTSQALFSIVPQGTGINASTFDAGSFRIKNTSPDGQKIKTLRVDLGSSLLPDMVFDPVGTAGDTLGKCFKPSSGGADVGLVAPADPCVTPFSEPRDGGYEVLEISFNNFDPGEEFTFTTDVDPTSIKGQTKSGGAGSVSGLELTGTLATVGFDDGSSHKAQTYRIPDSLSASKNILKANPPERPSIAVPGVNLSATTLSGEHTAATVAKAGQTVRISGPAGSTASLMIVEGALISEPEGGFYDLEDYEANSAVKVGEQTGQIGADGTVDLPVTLTRSSSTGGLNYIVAAIKDADGRTSPISNVVVLEYDESASEPVGALTADPQSVDFGEIELGKETSEQVTLANTGDAEVTVESTEVTGADAGQFTVSLDEPVTVAPNESAKLQVNAAPDSAGEKSATVTVGHTGDNPQLEIGLSGKGVEPPPPPDTKAPDTRITGGPSGFTKSRIAKFSFSSTEADSKFQCKLDKAPFGNCSSGQTYRNLRDGRHTFQVRSIDAAGNIDPTPAVRTFTVDAVSPKGTVKINGGKVYTKSPSVKLSLSASDPSPSSGVIRMRLKNDGGSWSGWMAYATTKSWTLKKANGTRTVYVQYRDRAGNLSTAAVDTIKLDMLKPTISKPSPKPNAKIRNRKPTISTVVRDRGSELRAANIKLYVDGKRVKFSYNQKTDRLVYKSKVLSFGRHTVKVVATDAAKNRTVKTWRFLVVRR